MRRWRCSMNARQTDITGVPADVAGVLVGRSMAWIQEAPSWSCCGKRLEADDRSAYVRAMFRRGGNDWEVGFVWALIGAEPPGGARTPGCCKELAFASGVLPARELAVLAAAASADGLAVGRVEGRVPAAMGAANWRRRPGFASHDHLPLPWPVTDYTLTPLNPEPQLPQGALVGSSCPSFPILPARGGRF